MKRKLIIVSNRLPITITEKNGQFEFEKSKGGLASGLSSYIESLKKGSKDDYESLWIGWPGLDTSKENRELLSKRLLKETGTIPIFLNKQKINNFYNGFCNRVIWPLFHYFPNLCQFRNDYWQDYISVNQIFCDKLLETIEDGDIVFIHDYHLMLLPKMLRAKRPNLSIGFFLHTPFPSFEVFRMMPSMWSKEILKGLLGADLVGFHTQDYTQYFLDSVQQLLGYESYLGEIFTSTQMVKADSFPIGIDFDKFFNASNDKKVISHKKVFDKTFKDKQLILSIDRLDYTKGIQNRLKGFAKFLEDNPNYRNKINLMTIVVPSRTEIPEYRQVKLEIEQLVSEINGKYSTLDWTPVIYQFKSLPFDQLAALYIRADVALVTPLRDGMNLVAKEYIATKKDQAGVLILSEFAGSIRELSEALIINATSIEEISSSLKKALEIDKKEQIRNNTLMQKKLKSNTINHWVDSMLSVLEDTKKQQNSLKSHLIDEALQKEIIQTYLKAKKRLFFLDYDGTLVPFAKNPALAKPPEEIIKMLKDLSSIESNEVVIVSGRDRHTLTNWFGHLPVGLSAEHGVWVKEKNGQWQMLKKLKNNWKIQIYPVFQKYSELLDGSFIEEKEFSLAYHYRVANPRIANIVTKDIISNLLYITPSLGLQILKGQKVIEVKNMGVNKGLAALHWMLNTKFDFLMAIGDDLTDEGLYSVLPNNCFSVKVGNHPSLARYNMQSQEKVIELLQELIEKDSKISKILPEVSKPALLTGPQSVESR